MIYNLKLILLDENFKKIKNDEFLDYVKNHLQNGDVYILQEDWISDNYVINWTRQLDKTDNYLKGDLFSTVCEKDDIVLRHVEETIRLCKRLTNNKYLVKFHISKLLQ